MVIAKLTEKLCSILSVIGKHTRKQQNTWWKMNFYMFMRKS